MTFVLLHVLDIWDTGVQIMGSVTTYPVTGQLPVANSVAYKYSVMLFLWG